MRYGVDYPSNVTVYTRFCRGVSQRGAFAPPDYAFHRPTPEFYPRTKRRYQMRVPG